MSSTTARAARGRAVLRAASILADTAAAIVLLTIDRLRRVPTEAAIERRVAQWARRTARRIGLRVHVEGEIPSGPVAIAANHLSYIDIVALWCVVPGAFVARADVADWPLVGLGGRLIDTIFVDRSRKRDLLRVLPQMRDALAAGRNVIFFPEATSTRGEAVLPFRSSLFDAAVREDAPVVGASLSYATPPGTPGADWSVCWWGDMTFTDHVFALLHLPGFEARIRFSEPIPVPGAGLGVPPETDRAFETVRRGTPPYGEGSILPMNEGMSRDARSLPERLHTAPLRSQERKALCRLTHEAIEKRFLPTTPGERPKVPAPPNAGTRA